MGYSPWGYEVSSMTEHTCTHTHTHHFLRKGCIKSILSMQLDVSLSFGYLQKMKFFPGPYG